MKKLILKIVWAAARWALSYAGTGAAWLLDRAADRTAGNAKKQAVCAWAKSAGEFFTMFAGALADGTITDDERAAVADAAQRIADKAKEVLP